MSKTKFIILISLILLLAAIFSGSVFSQNTNSSDINIDSNLLNLISKSLKEDNEVILDSIKVKNISDNTYSVYITGHNKEENKIYNWTLNLKDDGYSVNFSFDDTKNKSNKESTSSKPPTAKDLVGLMESPTYPKDLSEAEGTTKLMALISSTGMINKIKIIESSGYDSMDRVAQLTLKHGWEFREFSSAYKIPITIEYKIDEQNNKKVQVELGEIEFIEN
ncbi:energy transducer TonB [Halanaerobium congolense]|uniref:TonB-like protein n=1 Tax=Halanaerobium congolense TaxID=54121 RepID=A0A4R7DS90_9FIRM|nr:energy transducer TonB [Halanaerobium congolense]TDS24770.1 TonB-like protein [Halanaerobium congolense]SDL07043.1 TonB protein C-terminal [Halanaerobium congolense]SDN19377.1 TonB protein C-terminal [Halanaerobium congolense]